MQTKLPDTGTTIFAIMSSLAHECDAINLSQGFPGFNPEKALLDRVSDYLNGDFNQYAPMTGAPVLRDAIAGKIASHYGVSVDADREITVCDGATEGLFSAIQATVHPGDEVIVFDPAYDSYDPSVALAGGITKHLALRNSRSRPDFHIDWDELRDAISPRTRLIVLNFPHNPTGAILAENDLPALADIVRDTEVLLLSDEVYEHIVFDGEPHRSLLTHPELRARTFAVFSFGKTCHATGWKLGYCVAPPGMTEEFRKIHQWVCYSVMAPIQYAIADYLRESPDHYRELPQFYQEKRDRFCELLATSRFSMTPASGTFFQLLDYSQISTKEDTEYARQLTQEIGVASIPVSVFCDTPFERKLLRFCFAKDDDVLEEAAARLCQL